MEYHHYFYVIRHMSQSHKKVITKKDVQYVASLSRIHLRQEEVEHLTKDLDAILQYVHKLEKLDIGGVEPTSHVLPLQNVFRDDRVRPSLEQHEALRMTSQTQDGSFKVPKVI